MASSDERILEYLRNHYSARPSEIATSLRQYAPARLVRERLRVLSQAGYVAPFDDDYDLYELTGWGRLYLEGEVRADLLVPEPSTARPGHVLG